MTGPSRLFSANKSLLVQYLGIDRELASLDKAGLQSPYQKFKAIINATPTVMGLSKDAEWKSQLDDGAAWIPNIVDFIHIFIAKTQFYLVWKHFSHPLMTDYESCNFGMNYMTNSSTVFIYCTE